MEPIWGNCVLALVLWLVHYAVYMTCNHGLAPNARLQQLLRYLPAAAVAVLPLAVTGIAVWQPAVMRLVMVTELWALAYPLTFHLTYRKSAPDYDNQIDPAFALYQMGILGGLSVLLPPLCVVPFVLLSAAIPLFLIGYYAIYHHVTDVNAMLLIRQTNYNEVLEMVRFYGAGRVVVGTLLLAAVLWALAWGGGPMTTGQLLWWRGAVVGAEIVAVAYYLFKPHHGLFARTGLAKLYLEVSEYARSNSRYAQNQQERMAHLHATCRHPLPSPHTILMVIGESASREYMRAFTPMEENTTPWLCQMSEDRAHCVLFPHAYSCDIQTVPVLEKALTAYNQYDGGQFYTATSIVDVAKALGYRVHWYSNQGHLGAADTPVTLVAETADVAKWTNQQLGKKYYDEALIDFLDELHPDCNNLVVIHLKGSHFNYENRFPEAYRKWGDSGCHDQITNYKNTLLYTDSVLQQVFDTLRARFNLQAMVYCSDHGDIPDRHRQPNFGGFRDTHIPLMVWMSEAFAACRPDRAKALRDNSQRYWTNDLLYDLMCGVLDVACDDYKEANSLASSAYRFRRQDLTIMRGTVRVADDTHEQPQSPSTH